MLPESLRCPYYHLWCQNPGSGTAKVWEMEERPEMVMGQHRLGVVLSLTGEEVWSEARAPSGTATGLRFGEQGSEALHRLLGYPRGGGRLCGGWLEHQLLECGAGQGLPVCELTLGMWQWIRCTGFPRCQLSGCGAGRLRGRRVLRCLGHPSWPSGLGPGRSHG